MAMKFAPLDIRPSAFVIGILLIILSLFMLIPLSVGSYLGEPYVNGFLKSCMCSLFVGGLLIFAYRTSSVPQLHIRTAFFLTTAAWVAISAFGALPFMLSHNVPSFSHALFESMSALTTTGISTFLNFDTTPTYILVWRGLLQWLGGVGITLMAITLLPFLRIGGMQLFATESSSHYEKLFPKISQVTKFLFWLYMGLTTLCISFLWLSGLPFIKAFCYGLSTISTSGMPMVDGSIHYLNTPYVPWVILIFMILSASPLLLLAKIFSGNISLYLQDSQVKAYLKTMIFASIITTGLMWITTHDLTVMHVKSCIFHTVSMVTTSGFHDAAFQEWASSLQIFFIFLCVIGGCTGSTSGGIKIFRFQIIYRVIKSQIYKMIFPHGVFTPVYRKKNVDTHTVYAVLTLFVLFLALYILFAIGFTLSGFSQAKSLTLSASILSNCGSHFTSFPVMNLPEHTQWLMTLGMLLGRLEFLTVLILFTPAFWRR
ncbi:TrkH family potassium uptake protein [bacterium NHP-B]|nr:TrkH family potassium uptake protein [bacterium NHP-B]